MIIKLNLARNCLKYLVRIYGIKEIFVPYYSCDTVWKALRQEGCRLHFYHIDKNFMPLCKFNKNDFILYINYFGLCDENYKTLEKKYPNIIIDNTQSFYSKPSGLASFNSLRKFFKIQNGAYLYTKISINTNFQTDNLKLEPVLFHENYDKFVNNEKFLDNEPIKVISPNVEQEVLKIDFEKDKILRQKLFKKYAKIFDKYNLIKLPYDNKNVPYCYPFSTNEGKILSELAQFTLLRLWKAISKNYPERDFLNNTIALPLNDEIYCEKICTALSKIPKQ